MENQEQLVYEIYKILNQENIEDDGSIISIYDLIQYAKEELLELKKFTGRDSMLAREINDENYINKYIGKFKTSTEVKALGEYDTTSTIIIDSVYGDLTLIKNKNSNIIKVSPSYEGREEFLRTHYNCIDYSFSKLEEYSELIGNIDSKKYSFIFELNTFLYLKVYYDLKGNIKSEIHIKKNILDSINSDKNFIKLILDFNTNNLLKKFPFKINDDLNKYASNKILLLAQKRYQNEKVLDKQKSISY